MTCPIRMPTQEELDTLEIHWLTADTPWNPATISEPLDENTLSVPLGYSNHLGELDLSLLNLTSMDLGEVDPPTDEPLFEIHHAFRWIHLQHTPQPFINHYAQMVKLSDPDFQSYKPNFGWKPLDVIKKTFQATTQYGGLGTDAVTPLKRHYKS